MVEPTGFHSSLLEAVPADGGNTRRLYRALCIACTAAFIVRLSFQWQLSELGEFPLLADSTYYHPIPDSRRWFF